MPATTAVARLAAALSDVPPSERPLLSPLERACLRTAGFDWLVRDDDVQRRVRAA